MTQTLVVTDLHKRFGACAALQGVSLSVDRGEVVGFLGPNGAGKSTTMKIVTGYLAPDAGTVQVCGVDQAVDPLACRARIGYLPEELPLYPEMRVADYLDHVARLKGIVAGERRRQVVAAMEGAACAHNAGRRIRVLSKGNRQRVGLAQALLGDPALLVLDEPTSGLDPAQVANFRDLVRGLAQRHAVILSTHVLAEVAAVCDRAVIVHRGRTILSEPVSALAERASRVERVRIRLRMPAATLRASLPEWAAAEAGAEDELLVVAPPARRGELVALAEAHGGLRELVEERATLEEVFRGLIAADTSPAA
jgi:ABC-2 type transport system ATP-binding protein